MEANIKIVQEKTLYEINTHEICKLLRCIWGIVMGTKNQTHINNQLRAGNYMVAYVIDKEELMEEIQNTISMFDIGLIPIEDIRRLEHTMPKPGMIYYRTELKHMMRLMEQIFEGVTGKKIKFREEIFKR